jgi:hypothetical protein
MKSKILIILLICLFVFGCTKKDSKNSDDAITVQNEQETEEKLVPEVDIEEYCYYRINSPEGISIRESASLNSNIINKYPDNFIVIASEVDPYLVEIDGIKSYWVRIGHANDPSGWIFGGYLKPIEEHPADSLGVNEYRYTDYKSAYGEFTPSVIDANWESFYVFFKDYVGEPQQFELDAYDMYTSITYDDYKIFTGLYKDKQGDEGYFIVKTDLSEKTVLDKLVQSSDNSHLIVFLKPWSSDSEYISVGRWFESEAFYYISRNNISEKIEFSDF